MYGIKMGRRRKEERNGIKKKGRTGGRVASNLLFLLLKLHSVSLNNQRNKNDIWREAKNCCWDEECEGVVLQLGKSNCNYFCFVMLDL